MGLASHPRTYPSSFEVDMSEYSRRSRKAPHASKVGDILAKYMDDIGARKTVAEHQVLHQWPQLVGSSVAARTHARNIEDGRIYVEVANAVWIQELTMLKGMLLSRIHRVHPHVTDLVFVNRGQNP